MPPSSRIAIGRIDVRWSVHRGERTSPKNGRSRSIPLSPRLAEVLARQEQQCGRSTLVFPCQKGGYLTRDKVKRPMWRAIERARLPRIRFHDLRHSFASQLVMAGVPLVAIQQYLGHADMAMTALATSLRQPGRTTSGSWMALGEYGAATFGRTRRPDGGHTFSAKPDLEDPVLR